MKYLALLIRLSILGIGIYMVSKYASGTPPFLSGLVFILTAVYFCILAKFGPKAVSCPFKKECVGEKCCK